MKIQARLGGVAALALIAGLTMLGQTEEKQLNIEVRMEPPPSVHISGARSVYKGESVTLNWKCENCGGGIVSTNMGSQSGTSGSYTARRDSAGSTTYTITVKNRSGEQASASATIEWRNPAPPSCSISCNTHDPRGLPGNYCNGREAGASGLPYGHIRINWSASGATSVSLREDGGGSWSGASGSVVRQQSQSSWRAYTLSASGPGGSCSGVVYGRTSCFLKGTKILLCDGTHKNIEDFQGGECTLSYDVENGKMTESQVTEKVESGARQWFLVNDNLKVSVGHEIMANGKWTLSEDLKVGDKLFDAGGNEVEIKTFVTYNEVVTVYDLITEPTHNFFAGSIQQTFLVHNENVLPGHERTGLVKGMQVLLTNGKRVNVEDLKAGDKVITYDFEGKKYVVGTVKQTAQKQLTGYAVINNSFKVAKGHQFYKAAPEPKKKGKK